MWLVNIYKAKAQQGWVSGQPDFIDIGHINTPILDIAGQGETSRKPPLVRGQHLHYLVG